MNMLALTWIGIIAFGVIMYVILDGFDLGTGILTLFISDEADRELMISSILPLWDGNETWLVFGGAALYGAFPLAFAKILPLLYVPILVMVIALLFRGVAFEFRLKAHSSKKLWDGCFFAGSLIATFAQGTILGAFIQGFDLEHQWGLKQEIYHWLNPFNLFCGVALIFGYTLLGSNRLIAKTEGELQQKFFNISKKLQFIIFLSTLIVSIWSPYLDPALFDFWFDPATMYYLAVFPLLSVGLFFLHGYALVKRYEHIPFWSLVGIFLMCYFGFIISSYPFLVPRHISYIQAAAEPSTLLFMLIGAGVMLPLLLYYTYYAYRIFGGKVTERIGY